MCTSTAGRWRAPATIRPAVDRRLPARSSELPALKLRRLIAAMVLMIAAFVILRPPPASAQTSPSLTGRTVQLIVGFGAGGGFDLWGRLVARHIGRHLPG